MAAHEFKSLDIGGLVIDIPLIQGGMGVRISSSSLASAVSNEGGLGVVAAVGLGEEGTEGVDFKTRSCSALKSIIKETRARTKKPFGVNIMCALTDYDALVGIAQEESVDVIFSGAGLPLRLPELVKNPRTKLVPIVSSARAARIICRIWKRRYDRFPDAFVVEGPLAGGHLGYSLPELQDRDNFSLMRILKDVLCVVHGFEKNGARIPVIAAGGIFDGADIAGAMRAGASGVQMATRFVCTHECDASIKYKQAYLAAEEKDIVVIKSPVGMPGRVISNDFVKRICSGERIDFDCAYQCLATCDPKKVNYCIAKALINAYRGDLDKGFAMCGSNAFRIKKIVSVKELMTELTADTRHCLNA
jgi:nitronate monooxygenase